MVVHRVVSIVGTALLAAVLFVASGRETRATAAPDWPAFTAVYRVDGLSRGHEGEPVTTVWRLTYRDVRHWRKELVTGSDPREVGTVMAMAGTTYTLYSAVTKDTMASEYPDAPVVPERWLVPDRERFLLGRGYTRTSDADGRHTRYTKTERYPCAPTPCAVPDFRATETIVYEMASGLPVALTTEVEGVVRQRITIITLDLP